MRNRALTRLAELEAIADRIGAAPPDSWGMPWLDGRPEPQRSALQSIYSALGISAALALIITSEKRGDPPCTGGKYLEARDRAMRHFDGLLAAGRFDEAAAWLDATAAEHAAIIDGPTDDGPSQGERLRAALAGED